MLDSKVMQAAERAVRDALGACRPDWALILGSGWSDVADAFEARQGMSYADIPGLGDTPVAGHGGRLLLASHAGHDMLIFQGRRHWYEGLGWEPVAIPIHVCAALGVSVLALTNAAGGIRADLQPGDLLVIDDHINAIGTNPLIGAHNPTWGPRFPDQSDVYDRALRAILDQAAEGIEQKLHHGIYLAATGPSYETPAEVRAYRFLGADAVGMSTVPEALLANAAGLRVAGLSCITNHAAGVSTHSLSHEEVIEETRRAQPRMRRLLTHFFAQLAVSDPKPA